MKSKIDYQKRSNIYSPSDSSIAFILALIVPSILMFVVAIICMEITGLPMASNDESVKTFANTYKIGYILICALIPQIAFLFAFIFVSERKKVNYKTANQVNFKLNIWVLLLVVLIGIIALYGFSPLTAMIDHVTSGWGYKSSTANIDVSNFWNFFGTIFYIALIPAICEELIFRGIITNGFKKYGTVIAVVLSAVLFALVHQNLQQLLYQLFLGGVMAYIAIKTGSIVYTMILHFFNNFVILFVAFLTGDNQTVPEYNNAWSVIYPILLAILAIACVIGLLVLVNLILKRKKSVEIVAETEEESKEQVTKNKFDEFTVRADAQSKFYKNGFVVCALVMGVVFWIFSVVLSFVG